MQAERISFNVNDPQRLPSSWEMYCYCNSDLTHTQKDVFMTLIWFRDPGMKAFLSKKRLMAETGISNQQTLDKALRVLEEKGFIKILKFEYTRKGLKRKRWIYQFPKYQKCGKLPPRSSMSEDDISNIDIRLINKYNIPKDPQKVVRPEETKNESAVFLNEETGKNKSKLVTEPVQIEINAQVKDLKALKPSVTTKTLDDDIVCLTKEFGRQSVLTSLKCLCETSENVRNPGGWMRAHLRNPAWLERFVVKIREKEREAENRERVYQAQQQRLSQQKREKDAIKVENRKIDKILSSLGDDELLKLEQEARDSIPGNSKFINKFLMKVKIRILVKERYLGGSDE